MKEAVIAMRYAKALAEYAQEQGQFAEVRTDLDKLNDLLDPDMGDISVPELLDFLNTPVVTQADKIELTDVLCEKLSIGKIVSDFLNVLIVHRRIAIVPFIVRAYDQLAVKVTGEQPARAESARPLADGQRAALEKALADALGKPVRLSVVTRPALVGGVRVLIQDRQIDGSLAGRLGRLARTLERAEAGG